MKWLILFFAFSVSAQVSRLPYPIVSSKPAAASGAITNGQIVEWLFSEGTGTSVADNSGNGKTGTLENGASWTTGPSGYAYGAIYVDGSGGNNTGPRMTFSVATGVATYTITMWIYPESPTDLGALMTAGSTAGLFFVGGARYMDFYDAGDHFSTPAMTDNAWHHIAVTVNGTALTFYVDGVANGTATVNSSARTYTRMGDDNDSENFKGRFSHTQVFDVILSTGDIATKAGNPNL